MENLCVTFETWSIADGNYKPFYKGQKIDLAFSMNRTRFRRTKKEQCFLKQARFSEYSFRAKVIGNYLHEDVEGAFLVIDTGQYMFFMHHYRREKFPYQVGEFIIGKGQIYVDYFIWAEQSYKIENVPNIYYGFTIEKILYIEIPPVFVDMESCMTFFPTSLAAADLETVEIVEIEDMAIDNQCNENEDMVDNNECCQIMDMTQSFCLFELKLINT